MYCAVICAFIMTCSFFSHASTWQLPSADRRYNEVCFLTAHNAYAAKSHGFYYAQQNLSIEKQLALGARGLKIATWSDRSNNVILCHRGQFITRLICLGKAPDQLGAALEPLKHFLNNNPHEVVTLFLENHVENKAVLDSAFIKAGLEEFILTPAHWNPHHKDGWPTIEWMQRSNKRLVLFNSNEQTTLAFHQWHHMAENQWGALHPGRAKKERKESRKWRSFKRHLFAVNYFPMFRLNFGDPYENINSKGLSQCLQHVIQGLDEGYCVQRFPNFISVDYIEKGDALEYVNQFNALTEEEFERNYYFRAIQSM